MKEISDDVDGFIEDLIDTIDAFLWVRNAVVPHKVCGENDGIDNVSDVLSRSEKDDLYGEIYAVIETWFGQN